MHNLTPNICNYVYFSPSLLLLVDSFSFFLLFFFLLHLGSDINSLLGVIKNQWAYSLSAHVIYDEGYLLYSFITYPGNYFRCNDPVSSPLCGMHPTRFPLNQMQKLTPVVNPPGSELQTNRKSSEVMEKREWIRKGIRCQEIKPFSW